MFLLIELYPFTREYGQQRRLPTQISSRTTTLSATFCPLYADYFDIYYLSHFINSKLLVLLFLLVMFNCFKLLITLLTSFNIHYIIDYHFKNHQTYLNHNTKVSHSISATLNSHHHSKYWVICFHL